MVNVYYTLFLAWPYSEFVKHMKENVNFELIESSYSYNKFFS